MTDPDKLDVLAAAATPMTEAGRELWDHFAPPPLPDAQELHRRSAQGRRDKLLRGILAIETEARDAAARERDELRAAADWLLRSWDGRCSNPRCPSEHEGDAPDCPAWHVEQLRAALHPETTETGS